MTVSLGMPEVPIQPLAPRRHSRKVVLRHPHHPVEVGGDAPVSVQSMTTTLTADVNATLQQIAELTAAGCQIVRVAVPSQDDADALPGDRQQVRRSRSSPTSTSSPSTSSPRSTPAARPSASTRATSRRSTTRSSEIAKAAGDAGVPDPDRRQRRVPRQAAAGEVRQGHARGARRVGAVGVLAVRGARLPRHQDLGQAPRPGRHGAAPTALLAEQCDYPLHLGVTEAGPTFQGTIKSAVAFGALLAEGIGDTIRVSLSAPPVEEVKVGLQILESLEPAPARARDRVLPVVRPRPGRRLHPRRAGHRRARGARRSRCGSRSWAASSTAPARPARPTSASPPATARARSS